MVGSLTRTIVSIPEALIELLFVLVAVACFVGLHAWLQRRLSSEKLRRQNDVAGYLFSAVGILYAVVLGFVVVVVWQKYDATVSNVENEVDAAADLYHVADGLPDSVRLPVRSDLRNYAQAMITVEWPAMARDQTVPDTAAAFLEDLSHRVQTFVPKDAREQDSQQAAIADVERLFDSRRERLVHAAPAVPSVLWFALIVGALAMVAFCYVFGVENKPAQLMMTGILVGLIVILFVVIYEFETPFSGSVKISSDGWTVLQERIPNIR